MNFFVEFITGMSVGVELFMGKDLLPGDKFAMKIDLVIVRFTLVVT